MPGGEVQGDRGGLGYGNASKIILITLGDGLVVRGSGRSRPLSPLCLVGNLMPLDFVYPDSADGCRLRGSGRGRPLSAMSGGQLLGHKCDSATEVPLNNWELIRLGDGRSLRGN